MKKGLHPTRLILAAAGGITLLAGCIPSVTSTEGGNAARSAASAAPSDSMGVPKVAVCHIPPGNPANMHTIIVGEPAVKAHLAHGDTLGACPCDCGGDDGGTGGDTGGDTGGSDSVSGNN
jgi:hypothetical protein